MPCFIHVHTVFPSYPLLSFVHHPLHQDVLCPFSTQAQKGQRQVTTDRNLRNRSKIVFLTLSQVFFPSQQWEDEHPDIPFELVPLSLYWSNQPSSFNLVGRQS